MSQVRSLQHPPSHQAWRHAKAAALLRQAVPLKVIGDVFAHRSATSTMAYLKLGVEQLRGIALELPESVRTLSVRWLDEDIVKWVESRPAIAARPDITNGFGKQPTQREH